MFPITCERRHDWQPLRQVVARDGCEFPGYRVIGEKCTKCGMQRIPDTSHRAQDRAVESVAEGMSHALRRCRETPGDVLPEPGLRYRARPLMERNAKRLRGE